MYATNAGMFVKFKQVGSVTVESGHLVFVDQEEAGDTPNVYLDLGEAHYQTFPTLVIVGVNDGTFPVFEMTYNNFVIGYTIMTDGQVPNSGVLQ